MELKKHMKGPNTIKLKIIDRSVEKKQWREQSNSFKIDKILDESLQYFHPKGQYLSPISFKTFCPIQSLAYFSYSPSYKGKKA